MNVEAFPPGLTEKLVLDEPDLWDVDEFKGYKRMAIARGNTALRQVFEQTRNDLPKLIASVRWSVLCKPYRDFATAAGMSPNGYKPMEKDISPSNRPHRSKYTRLLAHWGKCGISVGIREQLLDILTNPELLEHDESSYDLLSSIESIRAQSLRLLGMKQMNAFYHRIGYDRGHDEVEKRFPSLYNTIWQRERTGTVPNYVEVVNLVDTMYARRSQKMKQTHALRRAQGEAVWSEVRKNQYLGRTIEEPLAAFLTEAEKHVTLHHGVTLTSEALRDHFGFGPLHAEQLIQCELIEGDAIERAAKTLFNKQAVAPFLQSWNAAFEAEQKRHRFNALAPAAMEERGYSAADVANILGVKAPEERGKDAPTQRKKRYRPDSEVRGVVFRNHVSRQIAVEALIQVLARNDAHADELREAYRAHRERYFRRTGARLEGKGLQMRIMRELANVSTKELALHFLPKNKHTDRKAIRQKDLELQRLERGEGKKHSIAFAKVFRILGSVAQARAEEAQTREAGFDEMDASLTKFTTVQGAAANLIKGMKSSNAVSDAMRNIARNDSEWLRYPVIVEVARGKTVPALPVMRTMVKATVDAVLPKEVVSDWYERFPEQLQRGAIDFGKVTRPLPRVLCTLIAAKEADVMRFFKDRVPGIVPTHGTKHLRDLEAGKPVDWRHLHKALLGVGLRFSHIPYRLAKGLYDTKGDLDAVLTELVPVLRKQRQDIHPANLPGLTMEELAPYQQKSKCRKGTG